ncbi:MAG: hypothetical protein WBG01_02915 [Bacteroidota bacterium]
MSANRKGSRKKSARRAKKQPGMLVEAAENIQEGAGVVGEKISDVAGQTAEVAGDILDAMKKRLHKAYVVGSRAVEGVTRSAQEYAEKYKQHAEMKRLAMERDRLTANLGFATYRHFKERKWAPELLFEDREVSGLVEKIEKLDREVVRIGEEFEREKE